MKSKKILGIGVIKEDNSYYKTAYYIDRNSKQIIDISSKKAIDPKKIAVNVFMDEILSAFDKEDISLFMFKCLFFYDTSFIYKNSSMFGACLVDIGYKEKQGYVKYKEGIIPFEYFKALEEIIKLPDYNSFTSKANRFIKKRKRAFN